MSDSENKSTVETTHLFENEFAYVTDEGDLILKESPVNEERKIASLDPEKIEEGLKSFKESFSELQKRADSFLDVLEKKGADELENAATEMEQLKEEMLQSDAIGDYNALMEKLESGFQKVKEKAEKSDPAEGKDKPGDGEEEKSDSETEVDPGASEEIAEPEKQDEQTESEEIVAEDSDEEVEKDVLEFYNELADKAEEIIKLTDWSYVSMEFGNIDNEWEEGPDPGELDLKPIRERIDQAKEEFEEKKQAHYEEQKRIKSENLDKKKELLEQLKLIVDEENWTATREVNKIRSKWDQVKPLPAGKADELQGQYDALIEEFEDHKVDRLVKKKQKEEENLVGKLVVLDKMKALVDSLDEKVEDWGDILKKFKKLDKQWKKIGRVPAEKNQETWNQYHSIQDEFHQVRFKHDKKYRQKIEKFLSQKKQLIKEAEALVDYEDLADAAREVNKLHRRWKKVGNLPQKDENELWNQFKAATDAFNQKKSENIDELREQEEENLKEKEKLIQKAEELKDSDEWDKTHQRLQNLMDQWKKAGPVPRKQSGKIWKRFKGAMDVFYDRRREHFKEVKKSRKQNLEEKNEILEKLKALKDHENPIKAVEEAKPLQEEFKSAGYVPIKHKNRMWKEYRETCDVIYDRFRAAKSAADIVGKENVSDFSTDDLALIQKKQKEAERTRKEINKMHDELIQMEESLSYFKPSGEGSSLLDDVKEKMSKIEARIEQKEEKLKELDKEIDQMKKED